MINLSELLTRIFGREDARASAAKAKNAELQAALTKAYDLIAQLQTEGVEDKKIVTDFQAAIAQAQSRATELDELNTTDAIKETTDEIKADPQPTPDPIAEDTTASEPGPTEPSVIDAAAEFISDIIEGTVEETDELL